MVSEKKQTKMIDKKLSSLNPCFSGGWSRSGGVIYEYPHREIVLILVLVEDGLGESGN